MLRRFFLFPALLSLTCLFVAADAAQAQRRGGSRGGYRGGVGVGVYIGPSNPYRYNDSPYWNDAYPSYYYTPAPPVEYAPPVAAVSNEAHIRVIVPDPQARVWFNDQLTRQQGTDRLFNTPALTSNGTYRIRAAWMQGGSEASQERDVTVAPGQTAIVDFTRR